MQNTVRKKIYIEPWNYSKSTLTGWEDPYFTYLFKLLIKMFKNKKVNSLIDIGFGGGKTLHYMAKRSMLTVGIELSFKLTKMVKEFYDEKDRVDYVVADAERLPFRDSSFQYILCTEVLEHLEDPKKAVLEMRRILKADGEAIISAPNFQDFSPVWATLKKIGVNPVAIWRLAGKLFNIPQTDIGLSIVSHSRKDPFEWCGIIKASGLKIESMNSIILAPRLLPSAAYRKLYSNKNIIKMVELVDLSLGKFFPFNVLGQGVLFTCRKKGRYGYGAASTICISSKDVSPLES